MSSSPSLLNMGSISSVSDVHGGSPGPGLREALLVPGWNLDLLVYGMLVLVVHSVPRAGGKQVMCSVVREGYTR